MKSHQKVLLSFILNTALTVTEIIGGIFANSSALIADGFKNLTDSIMLIVAYVAEKRCLNFPNNSIRTKTFAAKLNVIIIFLIASGTLTETFYHLNNPLPMNGWLVTIIGTLAILTNLAAGLMIAREKQVATRAALFGLFTSSVSGFAVLVSGLIEVYTNIRFFDFLTGLIITFMLVLVGARLALELRREIAISG